MLSTNPTSSRLPVACLLLAGIFAFVMSAGVAAETDFKGCVVQMHARPLSQLNGVSQVGASHDVGNITIMDFEGDYDRGLTVPRQEVAYKFFATHPDEYDFLVVFTTFEFSTGEAIAFYNPIQNDTRGIGKSIFDDSAFFGSSGRLHGFIDMAAMNRYALSPQEPGYQYSLITLAHEMMHRWVASVHFIDGQGQDSTDLLGQEGAHWNYFLDSDASIMYGSDWQLQDDDKFHSTDVKHRYSSLDLYLAGFAAASEVAPFTLIRNGDGGVATDYPKLGAVSGGQAETVTIEQVIAASGERMPDATSAQKDFTGAMILLKHPGDTVSPGKLLQLEQFRTRFQQQFAQMTDGRGNVRLFTQKRASGEVVTPGTLAGSGATESPSGVSAAVAWLESRQLVDGHWEDRPATALRDTVAVVGALTELDPDFSGLEAARSWLAARPAANEDQRAWRLIGSGLSDDAGALAAGQDEEGGFALRTGWNSSPYDTSLVASALAYQDSSASSLRAALALLSTEQNADGSLGFTTGGRGRVLTTLRAATLSRDTEYSSLAQHAADWISAQQRANGGLGLGAESSLSDTIEAYAMLGRLPLQPVVVTGLRTFVRQNQQHDGDWGGSAYLTATAALAYGHDQSANLLILGEALATPNPASDGAIVALQARVSNSSNVPVAATIARWYDGDPDEGGLQISGDIPVPALPAGASTSITQSWDTREQQGNHTLWLALDVDQAVSESSEQDNRASVDLSVQAPSSQAELLLHQADFSTDPVSVTELPSGVQIAGLVRNIGTQDAVGVAVRLVEAGNPEQMLAETTLDVSARSSVPVALEFSTSKPKTLDLRVLADPDHAIVEANEDNNEASLVLPYGQSLDLEVTAPDLVQVQAPALVGHDVDFDLTLRNRGTTDAPPVTLHVQVTQGSDITELMDGTVQIPAGQTISRRVTWRAGQVGAAQLQVTLDAHDQIAEAKETNNAATLDLTVVAQDQADLSFVSDSLVFAPVPGLQGQAFNASVDVRNLSSVATPGFRVALYASDPRTGASSLASTMVPALEGAMSTTASIHLADLGLSGDQTLYAKIDADNFVTETDEANNVIVKSLHIVPLPDVAVSVADVQLMPSLPVPGEPVQASVTVRNLGGQDAHGVLVRLLEGSPDAGAPVGADQGIDELPAGSALTLTWSWTLGVSPGARAVTVLADPDGIVREGSKDNNKASVPFDVQSNNFFASERYISPNGDGVRDASLVVFRMDGPGDVDVDIVNGAQYAVRHFTSVIINADMRGQVLWDGRDDHGRIVPDGDYHVIVYDEANQGRHGPSISVDNDRSSVLEAVDTPYEVYSEFPWNLFDYKIPPNTSTMNDQLFGIWDSSSYGSGLYRTSTLYPSSIPIISGNWLDAFTQAKGLRYAGMDQYAFDASGNTLVVTVEGETQENAFKTWVFETKVDQIDAPVLIGVLDNFENPTVLGFFDTTTIVIGPDKDGMLQLIDTRSKQVSQFRAMPAGYFRETKVTSLGVVLDEDSDGPTDFLPREQAKPAIHFPLLDESEVMSGDEMYNSSLSPNNLTVAINERNDEQELVEMVNLADGSRKTLLLGEPGIAEGPISHQRESVRRFGMGWLETQNKLVVQNAETNEVSIYTELGHLLRKEKIAAIERTGSYDLGYGSGENEGGDSGSTNQELADPNNVFPGVSTDLRTDHCKLYPQESIFGTEQQVFDPAAGKLYIAASETIAHDVNSEIYSLHLDSGIQTYGLLNESSPGYEVLQKGSLIPLASSYDAAQYPFFESCIEPEEWPRAILGDGARLRRDGHVQTLSRGTLPEPWAAPGELKAIWPDETRMLLRSSNSWGTYASLLNLSAVLQARTLGRGIELSGVAADRNFDYYSLDWASVDAPNDWHVLTPATSSEVFLDEFLVWVPPMPGMFDLRLNVVDKAGNHTSTSASAYSFASSVLDSFSLAPRYISPNGDGIQDQLVVKYRVRQPVTISVRINDENGNAVRLGDLTYGSTNLGLQEFVWDGRDDNGGIVPNGRYRINVDGFAAWVTVDTIPPLLSGRVSQTYKLYQPCVPTDKECPHLVRLGPAVTYQVRDADALEAAVETSEVGSNEWSVVGDVTGSGTLGLAGGQLSRIANHSFRLTAKDSAGNSASEVLGDIGEALVLQAVGRGFSPFYYQPPPFSIPPNIDGIPPIPPITLDQDADGILMASDASGQLTHVAVEMASPSAPDQWTMVGRYAIDAVRCSDSASCNHPAGSGDLAVPLNTQGWPPGTEAFVRLRGDREDSTRLYSNQGYIRVGGIEPPVCAGLDPVTGELGLVAHEHLDGPLESATLNMLPRTGAPVRVDARVIEDDRVSFSYGKNGNDANAWVVGVDGRGIKHESPHVELNSTQCDITDGGEGGGSDDTGAWSFLFSVRPVVRDQCDGKPSEKLNLRFFSHKPGRRLFRENGSHHVSAYNSPQAPTHISIRYINGITGANISLLDSDVDPFSMSELPDKFEISIAQWPEGVVEAEAALTYADGSTHEMRIDVPVVTQVPLVGLTKPLPGQRICATEISASVQELSVRGNVDSVSEVSYRTGIGAGAAPLAYYCEFAEGEFPGDRAAKPPHKCTSYDELKDIFGHSTSGDLGVIQDGLHVYNGISTIQVKALNWSGGTVCSKSTFYLDSDVDFVESRLPEPRDLARYGERTVVIAPQGDPGYAQGRFYLHSNELISYTATLYHATLQNGVLTLEGTPLGVVSHADSIQGDISFSWAGNIDGAIAADGIYGIKVAAGDDCGFTKTLFYGAVVDSIPPVVQITDPLANSTLSAPVVEVVGRVNDVALSSWSLDLALGGSSGVWQNIQKGVGVVPVSVPLASWSRGATTGSVTLRLSARDTYGNYSETFAPVLLTDPAKLLRGAQLQPRLFSPNEDGVSDATRLQVDLQQPATIEVHVEEMSGVPIASLYGGAASVGTLGVLWNGAAAAGTVADGTYKVVVDVQDPNGISPPESATLTATVDTAPPAVDVSQPDSGFASPDEAVSLHIEDTHLTSWEARLTRTADGTVMASLDGTQGGDVLLASLKDYNEGAYAIHVEARDGAGNITSRNKNFEIDATAPEVTLDTPIDAALLPVASATSVLGSVHDGHLASWALAVAPANDDSWIELVQDDGDRDPGEIFAWTPALPDGEYKLRLQAIDQAGNSSEVVHAIALDGTPPIADISSPVNDASIRTHLDMVGSATDAHFAGYRISVIEAANTDAGQWSDVYAGAAPIDNAQLAALDLNLEEDDYLLRLVVTDEVGLSSSKQVRVHIDSQPPPVPVNLIGHVEEHRNSVLDWSGVSATDLAGYRVYRGGASIDPALVGATHFVDADAPEGHLQYSVRAVDQAGNESVSSNVVDLIIDHTPPDVAILSPKDGERVRGLFNIVGTAYSANDFKEYRLSAQPGPTNELARSSLSVQGKTLASWNTLNLADETAVALHLEGEDNEGNVAISEVSVVVDNKPPAAPTGLTAVLNNADVETQWNPNGESDLLGYLLYRDSQLVNAVGPSQPADLRPFAVADAEYLDAQVPDGTHSYILYAIDRAGNVSLPSDPASLDPIDHEPPTMTIEQPLDGTQFEKSITVLASSADSDIADVQFAWRNQGSSSWTDLEPSFTEAPYRIIWTPGPGVEYGTYQIRALARDVGGRSDPSPPVVNVEYADLTAPGAASNPEAVADADTVHVSWTASSAPDVAGYHVYRGYDRVTSDPVNAVAFDDTDVSDGDYSYTVLAVDVSGNESPRSDEANTHVFGIDMVQPYTPTSEASVDLQGESAQAGSIGMHIDNDFGSSDTQAGSTAADGSFTLVAQALEPGGNHFTLRVADDSGNRSRPAEIWLDRSDVPAAPTGLAAVVTDHDVALRWNANSESDLLGYRVFQNDNPVLMDRPLGETPMPHAGPGYGEENVVDGDLATTWSVSGRFGSPDEGGEDPALDLSWVSSRIVTLARLTWFDEASATGNIDLYAWSGHAWILVAAARGEAQEISSLILAHPYRTTQLKFVIHGATADSSDYERLELGEIELLERPLQSTNSLDDTVLDGSYRYQVSAVNTHAQESSLSEMVTADIGDSEGPEAVVLSGSVAGSDVHLDWTASPSADVARYDLKRDGLIVASVAASDPRSHVDSNLLFGTYAYSVVVFDGFDNAGPESNVVNLTVSGTGPAVPVGLSLDAPPKGGALDVSWEAGVGGSEAVAYHLRRADSETGPWQTVAKQTETTFEDVPLNNGSTYFYTVEAEDAAGNLSGQSELASGTPRDRVAPAAPVLRFPTSAPFPATMESADSEVCGRAEAGTAVQISKNGIANATVTAASGYGAYEWGINGAAQPVLFAPDGHRYAYNTYYAGLVVQDRQAAAPMTLSDQYVNTMQWSERGARLYFHTAEGDEFYFWSPGAPVQQVDIPVMDAQTFAVDPSGNMLAAAGDYAKSGGTPMPGIWLVDMAEVASPWQLGTITPDQLDPDRPMLWSPDGRYLLLPQLNGSASLLNVSTAEVQPAFDYDQDVGPVWGQDSRSVAFVAGGELRVYDAITQAQLAVRQLGAMHTLALAWSPVGDQIAILDEEKLDILSSLDGHSLLPVPFFNYGYYSALTWTASGRLFATDSYDVLQIEPEGWFCSEPLALAPGTNQFWASATDATGNRSLDSAAIEVDTPVAGLPDLVVDDASIFFLPASGNAGKTYAALVTLRNAGSVAVDQPQMSVSLTTPGGTQRVLSQSSPLQKLEPGASQSTSYELGILPDPGTYIVGVVADPGGQLRESNESNNSASASLALASNGEPTLELNLSRSLYSPGDVVDGEVAVTNPGSVFSGRVHLSVIDADAAQVSDLGDQAVSDIAFGERWSGPVSWDPGSVIAGDYRIRAQLFDDQDELLSQLDVPFAIAMVRHIQLTVQADTPSAVIGQLVGVLTRVDYSDGNTSLNSASLHIAAVDPGGNEIWSSDQDLGALQPGYEIERDDSWPTADLGEGIYALRATLTLPDSSFDAESTVELSAATSGIVLGGGLAFDPGTTLIAGQALRLRYQVANRSSSPLSDVQTRLRIVEGAAQTPVSETDDQFDLDAGSSHEASLVLDAPPLALTSHAAILEARLPSDSPDQWRTLARQGFIVVDKLPPVIEILSPPGDGVQPAVVPFRASISDTHSDIANADVRVDGSAWQPVSAGLDSIYSRGLVDIADGAHVLTVRARDAWGNLATSEQRPFTVDATVPSIDITGVHDGDAVNHALAPQVSVSDDNLASSDIRLNGESYVSGISIDVDGDYVLTVRAEDDAGNTSVKSLRFTIDRVAPPVAILAPADNALVNQDAVHVDVTSEGDADITLLAGSYQTTANADESGQAAFDDVPLVPGDNRIQASAKDRAGNVGGPVSITLVYEANAVIGSVGPLVNQLVQGQPLVVPYTVNNVSDTALAELPVRLEVYPASSATAVLVDEFTVELAIGADHESSRTLDSASLEPDNYQVALLADTPPTSAPHEWVMLDSTSTQIISGSCQAADPDVIFMDGFERPAGDEIFCDGFELLDIPLGTAPASRVAKSQRFFAMLSNTRPWNFEMATRGNDQPIGVAL